MNAEKTTIDSIKGEYLTLLNMLEEAEPTEEELELIETSLESVKYDLDIKSEGYACVIKRLEANAGMIKAEADRLAKIAKTITNNVKRMEDKILECMLETGITELGTRPYSFKIAGNGGLAPLEVDLAADKLPEEFQKVIIEPDNTKIRAYLKELEAQGVECPWARLKERGKRLIIK